MRENKICPECKQLVGYDSHFKAWICANQTCGWMETEIEAGKPFKIVVTTKKDSWDIKQSLTINGEQKLEVDTSINGSALFCEEIAECIKNSIGEYVNGNYNNITIELIKA